MSVTSGMVGDGFYNRNSAPQMAAIEYVLPWLEAAVADMRLDDVPATVGLADFGCSEGRNSIAAMKRLIAACRRCTQRPLLTIHSDLPTNDFSGVFAGLRPAGRSVFDDASVFSAAVGGSMFGQLLPPGSVHFSMSFNALGFLDRRPLKRLPGYVLPNGPSERAGVGQVSDDERATFAMQADRDLQAFLHARAAELVGGGKLLLEVFGASDELRTCDGIYDALNGAMLEVLAAGSIDQRQYEDFYQPVYFRTLDELVAPFAAVESRLAKLYRVDRAECYEVPVSFVEAFHASGDVARYAAAFTNFFRAFTEPVLRSSFAGHPSLDRLIDDIYTRAERLVRDDPARYEFHYLSVAMLLTRRE